jgi:hypothetical protein
MLKASQNFKDNIYAAVRQIDARITFTMNGVTKVYDDDTIIRFNILEETHPVNETLASNELKVTFNNQDNEFDFINFQNLSQIIANKPILKAEAGLYLTDFAEDSKTANFVGKVYNSTVANGHSAFMRTATTLQTPSQFTYSSQGVYTAISTLNNAFAQEATVVNANIPQHLFSFDIIRILTDKFGDVIWAGKNTLADKIAFAKTILKTVTFNWHGYGIGLAGNKITISIWNPNALAWQTPVSHTLGTVQKLSISPTSIADFINSSGFVHFNAYTDASNGTVKTWTNTDFVELVATTNEFEVKEWIPMGTYHLHEWESNKSAKTVSLVGRDLFAQLDEVSYTDSGKTNLYDLAVDILAKGGITSYSIDSSLQSITKPLLAEARNSKELLQLIGVASRCVVFQDRYGVINIKTMINLDGSSNYLTYAGQPQMFAGTSTYALTTTDAGMKYLSIDNMFDYPSISLEKSIREITVKVYDTNGVHDYIVTNPLVTGANGEAFTIDNPFITTDAQAKSAAIWFMKESDYNAVYRTNWRGNMLLECVDVVLIEDGFGSNKQSRIFRQEFTYEGYLSGVTESRGGI